MTLNDAENLCTLWTVVNVERKKGIADNEGHRNPSNTVPKNPGTIPEIVLSFDIDYSIPIEIGIVMKLIPHTNLSRLTAATYRPG
jgi:hypothetical protein